MHGHWEGASEWESGPSSKQDLKTVPAILRLGFSAFTRGCQSLLSLSVTEPSRTPQSAQRQRAGRPHCLLPGPQLLMSPQGPTPRTPPQGCWVWPEITEEKEKGTRQKRSIHRGRGWEERHYGVSGAEGRDEWLDRGERHQVRGGAGPTRRSLPSVCVCV